VEQERERKNLIFPSTASNGKQPKEENTIIKHGVIGK